MQNNKPRLSGMTGFMFLWLGQVISVLASFMTQFALTIWAYQETGQATALALVTVFFITPFLLISPVAGVLVDRYNRKLMMMLSDFGAGVSTIFILVMHSMGTLEIWHLYLAAAINGTFNSFQWPAYSSAISLMIPKEQYGRANGLMSLIEVGPGVIAPLIAGALLPIIGFAGILWIDVVTFTLAIGALLLIFVPQPEKTEEGREAQGGMFKEAIYGFKYIFDRPSLLGLQLVFFFANFFAGIGFALVAPMVLARTGNNELIFGSVQSIGAIGGVVGGVLMSTWGGFNKKVHGVLIGWIISGVIGIILFGWGQTLLIWGIGLFVGASMGPIINGSNQAIWQAKVAPDLQGRVFSARRLIAWLTTPITPIIGGTLADFVLEPAMAEGGSLSESLGWLVGTGPGAGMALIVIAAGILSAIVGAVGYFFPVIRDAEALMPDHQQDAKQAVEALDPEPAVA
jgi:hypothetical protein